MLGIGFEAAYYSRDMDSIQKNHLGEFSRKTLFQETSC